MKVSQIFFATLFFSLPTYAFELAAGLTPPSQQKVMLSYSGLFYDKSDFPQERASTSYQTMNFVAPVYKTETEAVSLSLSGTQLAVKPGQGNLSELYDLQVGLGYTKALDDKRLWSVSARYGSASDKPFEDSTVTTLGVTAFYSYPSDETSRWLLLLDYSNNRPILNEIPLPGFAYFYAPSKTFRGVFGVPFVSLNWDYAEKWGMEVFTLVPWIFKASVNYKLNEYARIYTGVDFSQVTYYLYGRQNRNDRLFYDEKKVFLGVKSPLSKSVFAELEMGHAFDRAFFVDENYTTNPDNPVEIGNAFYGKVSLRFLL
ncbi:hypothetical protein [Bdellovibrio bacteriovorus]|uniref:hypothetical protein n=1 Tax=Bdellovibrio TaxID=958 RepID=UPI0035A8984A